MVSFQALQKRLKPFNHTNLDMIFKFRHKQTSKTIKIHTPINPFVGAPIKLWPGPPLGTPGGFPQANPHLMQSADYHIYNMVAHQDPYAVPGGCIAESSLH